MQIAWFVVPVAVLGIGVYYIGRRLMRTMSLSKRARRIVWIALALWIVAIYSSLLFGRNAIAPNSLPAWFAYVSMGLLSFLFTGLAIRDIVWYAVRGMAKLRSLASRRSRTREQITIDEARREHLLRWTNAAVIGGAGLFTGYGLYEARRTPSIVEIDASIDRLPQAFEGFRIIQITDIHAGLTIGRDWIEGVAGEVARLRPDAIAFTGDLADGSVASLRDAVAPLGELRAPSGLYFVTGNHEYYSGADDWVREAGRLGYDVLMNEHRFIERGGQRIVLAGVTDITAGRHVQSHASDPALALRNAPDDLVRILLAHQPKTLHQIDTASADVDVRFDLMLSGHTHGGQFFPWNLLTLLDQPYVSGLHRHGPGQIYVSRGTGYWGPPVRLAARSEITVITLRAAVPTAA